MNSQNQIKRLLSEPAALEQVRALAALASHRNAQAEQMIRWYRLRWRTDPGATKRAPQDAR